MSENFLQIVPGTTNVFSVFETKDGPIIIRGQIPTDILLYGDDESLLRFVKSMRKDILYSKKSFEAKRDFEKIIPEE
jgi:hypothetical protein